MIDTQVHDALLAADGWDLARLENLAAQSFGGAGGGDWYFQRSATESWSLEDGVVRSGAYSIERGAGIRLIAGAQTGFAYSDDLSPEALAGAARQARAVLRSGRDAADLPASALRVSVASRVSPLYASSEPRASVPDAEKLDLMHRVDQAARAADLRVREVFVSLASSHEHVLVLDHEGRCATDVRPLVRMNVRVQVEQGGRRESGSAGGGGRVDLSWFFVDERAVGYAREAVRQALVALEAGPAPAGTLPVVLGPGWPGVLLHEAVGHGLEGDFNRKGTSAFAGRIGERVAAPGVTVVDEGAIPERRGSLTIDDEGTPTQRTVLIEDGVLRGYLQDRLNARLMGVTSTGNGRRESYAHLPMPRMTNTFMTAGEADPTEIIASVSRGLYAVNFGGGQVDITSGKFVFSASEAYWIENGRVTRPVKGATLIGDGPEVLKRVSMIGNDLALDPGIGVCGKDGQGVPVGVGQPTLKIDAMTIGGTEAA
ncbi:MAG: metalloprotease TldD [Thioalkalivibrionaceae bacterium]